MFVGYGMLKSLLMLALIIEAGMLISFAVQEFLDSGVHGRAGLAEGLQRALQPYAIYKINTVMYKW